jgi:hypothetical protein
MANAVLFIGWGAAIPGREQKGLQVFGEAMQFMTRMQQQGVIESFEPVALEPHGGDLTGFVLVRGDMERLSRLRVEQEFIDLTTRAQLIVTNFGVVLGFIGERLNQLFADFGKQAAELA